MYTYMYIIISMCVYIYICVCKVYIIISTHIFRICASVQLPPAQATLTEALLRPPAETQKDLEDMVPRVIPA